MSVIEDSSNGSITMFQISQAWILDNLKSEIFFGVLLIIIGIFWKYVFEIYSAIRITRIISIHNSPTSTLRKGIYARDRFIQIFEAKAPIASRNFLVKFLAGGSRKGVKYIYCQKCYADGTMARE